jgi:two-component system, LytTR family, sensor kinase
VKFTPRYKFWKVALAFICFGIFGYMMYTITKSEEAKETVEENHSWQSSLHMFLYILTFFYFVINYFYQYIAAGKKWWQFVKLICLIILVATAYYTFLYYTFPVFLQKDYGSLENLYQAVFGTVFPLLLVSFVLAFFGYLWESSKQRRILEAQKLQLEAQISQANFNFLKSQINPHFLHNTLNFLYAKSLPYSSELSEGILTLSDIMRYALSQGNQKDGKAPLKDEIEHVHNVIKISQLRYSNQLTVNFQVTGDPGEKRIVPFVLITLVENAFKHGELKNPENPIEIRLDITGNKLRFYCRNKKKTGRKDISTGIGLENIHKRLELAYGSKYRYTVNDETEFYATELIIYEL